MPHVSDGAVLADLEGSCAERIDNDARQSPIQIAFMLVEVEPSLKIVSAIPAVFYLTFQALSFT